METPVKAGDLYTNELARFNLLFWLARTIQQILFFKLEHAVSRAFLLLFITGALLYAVPACYVSRYYAQLATC